ncbi:hypothetical protein J3F83DRAFT_743882 [Trichoderma novae-zelandiae]
MLAAALGLARRRRAEAAALPCLSGHRPAGSGCMLAEPGWLLASAQVPWSVYVRVRDAERLGREACEDGERRHVRLIAESVRRDGRVADGLLGVHGRCLDGDDADEAFGDGMSNGRWC